MAQENIPLVITLGGVDKAVTSVREFAKAIKEAQNRLLLIGDEGSLAYQQLDKDIQKARIQLQEFREDANQTKVGRELKDFIEVGSSITAVFVGAQAALQAFGVESDSAGKASAAVQNLLTIAITAQTLAQNKNAIAKVANTVTTVAQTAATQGLIAATRLLWTTMLANPITAIVVLIGALATAYAVLSDDTDEAAAAQEKYNQTLKDTNDENDRRIALLQAQGKDEISIQKERIIAAEELAGIQEAELTRLQTINRFSKETAAQRKLVIEAQAKVEQEQATLTRLEEEALERQRQKNAENSRKRNEELKKQLIEQIQIKTEQLKLELELFSVGQKFQQLNIPLETEKQVEAFKALAKTVDDNVNVREKYFNLIKDQSDFDQKRIDTLIKEINVLKEGAKSVSLLGSDITKLATKLESGDFSNAIMGIIKEFTKTDAQKLTAEAKKFKTNLDLIGEGFKKAATDIDKSNFREVVRQNLDIEEGVAVSIDEITFARQRLVKTQQEFVADFVAANATIKQGVTGYAEEQKGLTEAGKALFSNLVSNQKEALKFEKAVDELRLKLIKLKEEQTKLVESGKVVTGFLIQNRDEITKALTIDLGTLEQNRADILDLEATIQSGRFDEAQKFAQDIEFLEYDLLQQGIDIRKASYEEKLKLLKTYLEKEVKETEDAEGKKRKSQAETISGITASIQAFQSVLNSLAQTSSQYYALQLQLLSEQSEEIQSKIIGDSKEAIELRLEQEKIFNEKKKQLEKQAAVSALRISLAQSLANVAESITKAFTAGPIVGQIAASIIAVLGVRQTALIAAQISSIQSLQRGGMIKGQGGLVVGPSHEYGGVKFQGGGIELEGGEAVINRQSAVKYGSLLSSINQMGGGRPLVSNNFDDSRIVEAIAKQRSEPIRAYVVEQDITSKQGVTRRLEQLSQI